MAFNTFRLKFTLTEYAGDNPNADNVSNYRMIYWFLFIYYAFQGIDELIEFYSVSFERQKGALALLFELNYFLGLCLGGYLFVFMLQDKSKIDMATVNSPNGTDYGALQSWLMFQWVIVILGICLSIALSCCFKSMNSDH